MCKHYDSWDVDKVSEAGVQFHCTDPLVTLLANIHQFVDGVCRSVGIGTRWSFCRCWCENKCLVVAQSFPHAKTSGPRQRVLMITSPSNKIWYLLTAHRRWSIYSSVWQQTSSRCLCSLQIVHISTGLITRYETFFSKGCSQQVQNVDEF